MVTPAYAPPVSATKIERTAIKELKIDETEEVKEKAKVKAKAEVKENNQMMTKVTNIMELVSSSAQKQ